MNAETARLRGLQAAAERIAGSLVELELDSSRKLLEASTLEGESAARWAAASAALTELWRRHGLLEELLQRAEAAARGTRIDELRSLLAGPSIELAQTEVPLAQRTLQGGSRSVENCSATELIASMSTMFDEVTRVISGIATAWDTLVRNLEAADRLLTECRLLAQEVGEESHAGLLADEQVIERLSSAVRTDPLSVSAGDVDGLTQSLRALRDELQEAAWLKRDFDARIGEARALLERVRTAAGEAHAAHDEAQLKIAQPSAPPVPPLPAEIDTELERVGDLATQGAWKAAGNSLARWTAATGALLDDVRRAREANRAPIEARDQFRALLEAYQVKAARLGVVEEPPVAAIFARARETLYRAPTDLALAAQLVRSYQEALSARRPSAEARR
jgi:hypothetical protein